MNQDFTVKKSNICLKKKIRAEGFTWKKNPAQAESEKKNSCMLKIPIFHSGNVSADVFWNSLALEVRQLTSLYVFQEKLKNLNLDLCIISTRPPC